MAVRFATIGRLIGYRFGSDGSVWSRWARNALKGRPGGGGTVTVLGDTWRRLIPQQSGAGYLAVRLKEGNRIVHYRVNRLILEAFIGPRPVGKLCRHLDGNPANNALSNLFWGTQQENIGDAMHHGRVPKGDAHWTRQPNRTKKPGPKPRADRSS